MQDVIKAVQVGVNSIKEQGEQIISLSNRLLTDAGFAEAIKILANPKESNSRVIISGIGKSGHVGKKMAATLSSTGTASIFVHSTEAFHGDLGMIRPEDTLVLISNSGETDEVIKLIPTLKSWGNRIISICGCPTSILAKHADVNIDISLDREVCPNNLAPTSSTTATMVIGDALACALMNHVNFEANDFAKYHPGGSLGKRLLHTVRDVQRAYSSVPVVGYNDDLLEVAIKMSEKRAGVALVKSGEGVLKGVITDGDLRRHSVKRLTSAKESILPISACGIMTADPITVNGDTSLAVALDVMKANRIKWLIVEEEGNHSFVEYLDVI